MDIKKIERNLLKKQAIKPKSAHQCPYCGSYNTDEDYYVNTIEVVDYTTGSVSIPLEIAQARLCKDCDQEYTAYYRVTFTESTEN